MEEILTSGAMPLPEHITRQKIGEKFSLTPAELDLLAGDDAAMSSARLFALNSLDAISPDGRCRALTNGLPVPESWLAARSGLAAEEIRAFDRGGEMETEKKCRLFAAKMTAVRYFAFTVFPALRETYGPEFRSFVREHPEALKGESLPEEAVSPEEMLAEDTRYFCEKTTLTESALEKLAPEGVPAPERPPAAGCGGGAPQPFSIGRHRIIIQKFVAL